MSPLINAWKFLPLLLWLAFAPQGLANVACEAVQNAASLSSLQKLEKLEKIGKGGEGKIYRARDAFGNEFALKETSHIENELEVTNFVYIVNRNNPDVSGIIKYERVNIEGLDYLKMPLYKESLQQVLNAIHLKQHKISAAELQKIKEKLVALVALIHRAGYVHCDLKPKNIMLDNAFNPIIVDFGSAVGMGMRFRGGTPGYMSKNQEGHGRAGADDDILGGLAASLKQIDDVLVFME